MIQAPITKLELKPFLQRSNSKALAILTWIWGSIFCCFALAAYFPYWPIYLFVIFVLGGRQHGLGMIMHETGHNTFFDNRRLNEITGNWLTAPFVLLNGKTYTAYHMKHHKRAGTEHDPDLGNYKNYPITGMSLLRKISRDLFGLSGIKVLAYLMFSGKDMFSGEKRKHYALVKGSAANFLLFGALYLSGQPQLYALWVVAYLTSYMLFLRVRQINEHAGVPDLFAGEPKYNTRSMPSSILGFLFTSPVPGLNYHCEHHLFMGAPVYHLKALHHLLVKRGYYDDVPQINGYRQLLPHLVRGVA
jgi:fatty acid desaturase